MLVEDFWDAVQQYAPSWFGQAMGIGPQANNPRGPNPQGPAVNDVGPGQDWGPVRDVNVNEPLNPENQGNEPADVHRRIVFEESWDEVRDRAAQGGILGPVRLP